MAELCTDDGYFSSRRGTCGFRWHTCGHTGKWLVMASGGCEGFRISSLFHAVVDDFGNLVKVGRA